jgi:hypothetical protein
MREALPGPTEAMKRQAAALDALSATSSAVMMPVPMKLSEPTRAALIVIGYYAMLLTIFGGLALVAMLAKAFGGGN